MYTGRLNEKVNKSNINLAIEAVKAAFGSNNEVEYVELEDGSFSIKLNGEELFRVDGNIRIGDIALALSNVLGNGAPSINTSPKSRQGIRQLTDDEKIYVNLTVASQIQDLYLSAASKMSSYESLTSDMKSVLKEKLRAYYWTLKDNTTEQLTLLSNYLNSLSSVIGTCISMYLNKDTKDHNELKEMCDYLWDGLDNYRTEGKQSIEYSMSNLNTFGIITVDEYYEIMAGRDDYFDEYYQMIVSDLNDELAIQYQVLLRDTVPEVLNLIVESQYRSLDNSDDYTLVQYKDDCMRDTLKYYKIDDLKDFKYKDLGIPENTWNEKDDYGKALLILSYKNRDINTGIDTLENDFVNILTSNSRNKQEVNLLPFHLLSSASNLFNTEGKTPKEIVSNFLNYQSGVEEIMGRLSTGTISITDSFSFINMTAGVQKEQAWHDTLVECGFSEDVLKTYGVNNIFNETFNEEFFQNVYIKDGEEGLNKIIDVYAKKLYGENATIEIPSDVMDRFITGSEYSRIFNSMLSNTYSNFANKKIVIDNAIENFNLALAQSVDTRDVTDDDIERAKSLYYPNGDWKYLEDWQLRFLAKMSKDPVSSLIVNDMVDGLESIGDYASDEEYSLLSDLLPQGAVYKFNKGNAFVSFSSSGSLSILNNNCNKDIMPELINSNQINKMLGIDETHPLSYELDKNGNYQIYVDDNGNKNFLCSFKYDSQHGLYDLDSINESIYRRNRLSYGVNPYILEGTSDLPFKFENNVAAKKGEEMAFDLLQSASNPWNLNNEFINNYINNAHSIIVGQPLMIALGLGQGMYSSTKGVYNFFMADGKLDADDYCNIYLTNILSEDKSLYCDYKNGDPNVLYNLGTDYHINEIDDNGSKMYELLYDGGTIKFTEEELDDIKASEYKVYEILYKKGKITKEEYQKYSNLYLRKDNDNYINTLVNLNNNMAGMADDIFKGEYSLSSSVGNMVIPLALSIVDPALMSGWTFLSVSGNQKEELLREGKENSILTFSEACCYGLAAVLSEKMLGRIHGYSNHADEIMGMFDWMTKTKTGTFIATMLSNSIGEVNEELFENVVGYGIKLGFEGELPSWQQVAQETWQTAYMTFLSTPLINFMGSGMRGQNYFDAATMNFIEEHEIGKLKVKYSPAELLQFTRQDGTLDNEGFMNYLLSKGDRFSSDNVNDILTFIANNNEEIVNGKININSDGKNAADISQHDKVDFLFNNMDFLKKYFIEKGGILTTSFDKFIVGYKNDNGEFGRIDYFTVDELYEKLINIYSLNLDLIHNEFESEIVGIYANDIRFKNAEINARLLQYTEKWGLIDQRACYKLYVNSLKGGIRYQQFVEYAKNQYGMTNDTIDIILSSMDSVNGVCSYANLANLFVKYGNPNVLNCPPEMLLFDAFVLTKGNGLLIETEFGYDVDPSYLTRRPDIRKDGWVFKEIPSLMTPTGDQRYVFDELAVQEHLKDLNLSYSTDPYLGSDGYPKRAPNETLDSVALNSGVEMYNYRTGEVRILSGGHVVPVFAEGKNFYLVSSWGEYWVISKNAGKSGYSGNIYPRYSSPR